MLAWLLEFFEAVQGIVCISTGMLAYLITYGAVVMGGVWKTGITSSTIGTMIPDQSSAYGVVILDGLVTTGATSSSINR